MCVNLHLCRRNYRPDRNEVRPRCCCNLECFFGLLKGSEIYDPFEVFCARPKKEAESAGYSAKIPYVNDGDGEINMPHSLSSHPVVRNLNSTMLADDALELRA